MEEIWKDIQGYEGLYQVSNHGRVRSLDRFVKNGRGIKKTYGIILTPYKTSHGYLFVKLGRFGKHAAVHRLVAKAFIDNPELLPEVNHIDGNKTNNKQSNLEWVTHRENTIHASVHGLLHTHRVEYAGRPKKKIQFLKEGKIVFEFDSLTEAGEFFGDRRKESYFSSILLKKPKMPSTYQGYELKYGN